MEIIDTRDLLKRKNELEDLKQALDDAREALTTAQGGAPWRDELEALESELEAAQEAFGEDEREELTELEELESEISGFRDGGIMIPESGFTEYAQELAEDIGAMGRDQSLWPYNHIDWREAAHELKQDYTEVTWQGRTYLVRA